VTVLHNVYSSLSLKKIKVNAIAPTISTTASGMAMISGMVFPCLYRLDSPVFGLDGVGEALGTFTQTKGS
jgi:hypothetical protein